MRRKLTIVLWIFLWSSVMAVAANMSFLLEAQKTEEAVDRSRAVWNRAVAQDAVLAALVKRKDLKVTLKKREGEYLLMAGPLPQDDEAVLLYWKLHRVFPNMVALVSPPPASDTVSSLPVGRPEGVPRGTFILWVALFAMALVGILGLFFSSRQLQKLQEQYERILERHEEINERIHGLFSHMGEDIYHLGKEVADFTKQLLHEDSQSPTKPRLQQVMQLDQRLMESATNLLGFLHLKARKITVKKETFSINNLLDEVTGTLKMELKEIETELIFQMDRDVPRLVIGDFVHTAEALSKILEHAIRYETGGEVRLEMSAYAPYEGGGELRIRIYYFSSREEESVENFFMPVYDETKKEYRRLGLHIAYELVQLLDGKIGVSSRVKEGEHLVDLSLPVQIPDEKEQRKYHLPDRSWIRKEIFIVARHYNTSLALEKMFTYFRHRVTVMTAEMFEHKRPKLDHYDILLLDEEFIGTLFANYVKKIKKRKELKVVALHNIFHATRKSVAEEIIDRRIDKPLNQEKIFSLIVELSRQPILTSPPSEKRSPQPRPPEETETARVFTDKYPEQKGVGLNDFNDFSGAKIMVVEDNAVNLKMLLKILEKSGIDIQVARNGLEAVQIVETLPSKAIDLILMDINMPVMDGYTATEKIRKNPEHHNTTIVALSALNQRNEIDRMRRVGMDGYLEKPLNIGKLYTVFELYLPKSTAAKRMPRAEEIPPPKAIDWDVAMAHANEDEILLRELLEGFVDAYRDFGDEIREMSRRREKEKIRQAFLDLLGIGGSIGAKELYRLNQEIYRALVDDRMEEAGEKLPEFLRMLRELVASLERYLSKT